MKTKDKLALKRTVKAVSKRALVIRFLTVAILALFLITGVTYAFSIFFDTTGSFTVKIPKYNMLGGLSLSETADFKRPIERITATPLTKAYNISVKDLPDNLPDIDGSHGTKNYIALTFYLKNAGKYIYTIQQTLSISGVTNGVDKAIRYRVYSGDSYIDYAKPKSDGSGPEPGTTAFSSEGIVFQKIFSEFKPGDVNKYTIVIWLEGDDPECVDSIIGGTIESVMTFKVLSRTEPK